MFRIPAACFHGFRGDISLMQLLIVEDEKKVAKTLQAGLEAEGFMVTLAATGEEGQAQAVSTSFDLILLDVMLPGKSGIEILTTLRRRGLRTPVLLLTARDAVSDRVLGLDAGADDYLTKPFAFAELLARIRALLRRGRPEESLRFTCADLELDAAARFVTRAGRRIDLTPREFDLLQMLLRHHGQIVSRDMLAQQIWREPGRVTPLDNVIDVHMARLRQKVDSPGCGRLIHTVRGAGFLLQEGEPW